MFKKNNRQPEQTICLFFSAGRELCSDRNDISLPPLEYF